MVLIKLSQETDYRILNRVRIGQHEWTQLNMYEDYLWTLKQNNNNNS